MRHKHQSRLIELGKDLVILLLACSLLYLLGRTLISVERLNELRGLLDRGDQDSVVASQTQATSIRIRPLRLAVYHEGMRYGVQYDREGTDRAYDELYTLITEALSSVGTTEKVPENRWEQALRSMGIYLDFYYAIPFDLLAESTEKLVSTGPVRRMCLAEDQSGGVSLFFVNEEEEYYAAQTTLSKDIHLATAVEGFSPNGAQFAFEVPGLESVGDYTLVTATPQPAVYRSENPLVEDTARVKELLSALSFRSQNNLNPANGGQLVEQNDSLRLSREGVVSFHTIGDTEFRFSAPDSSTRTVLSYVQSLAQATVGAWSGEARLMLEQINVSGAQMEIIFQYNLNGTPVLLADGEHAARFIVHNGAVTDFTLYLRSYAKTEDITSILPVAQAAAAVEALTYREKELTLLYRDSGGELTTAGWVAVG